MYYVYEEKEEEVPHKKWTQVLIFSTTQPPTLVLNYTLTSIRVYGYSPAVGIWHKFLLSVFLLVQITLHYFRYTILFEIDINYRFICSLVSSCHRIMVRTCNGLELRDSNTYNMRDSSSELIDSHDVFPHTDRDELQRSTRYQ